MGDAAAAAPEQRGYLVNEYSNQKEFLILRGGVLRLRDAPHGVEVASIYLAHGTSVSLRSNIVIQIDCKVPEKREYVLIGSTPAEAERWHNAIRAAIRAEKAKMESYRVMMEEGFTMHKYNYSNSKRSRRFFWSADEGKQLCWGRAKDEDTQSVNLRECIGITYGPVTTTFQRCHTLEDPAWSCFSLLFMGRTLDLTVNHEVAVQQWLLGLQHLISLHGIGSMPPMSTAKFLLMKVQLKLQVAAHQHSLVMGRYLVERVRELAGLGTSTALAAGNGRSTRASSEVAGAADAAAAGAKDCTGVKKLKKKNSIVAGGAIVGAAIGEAVGQTDASQRVLKLQQALKERSVQVEAVETALKNADTLSPIGLREKLHDAVVAIKSLCASLSSEAGQLAESSEQLPAKAVGAASGDKLEKALKKLQQKLEESEAKRAALEQDLNSVRANPAAVGSAKNGYPAADSEDSKRSKLLETKVRELDSKLQETVASQNAKEVAAEAAAASELAAIRQQLDDRERQLQKAKQSEAQLVEQLKQSRELSHKLGPRARQLQATVVRLRDGHSQARADAVAVRDKFGGELVQLLDANTKIAARFKMLEDRHKASVEERKKLHNTILDLKGNIRVFVRVRPINAAETPTEPEGEPTVSFKDEQNIGVYDQAYSRRKWFEFDQVFDMKTEQAKVFEEAKPLATSVLDGYNVCIFAYGQTGSGKTHTMTGNTKDPGLNTNALKELFRIRDERKGEYDINISISVTEIYNETIRDLLNPGNKKLDVKMNPDGTSGVPGLEERSVETVEAVMKCIADASKNRATSSTDMNSESSRSHSIVTVRTQCTLRGSSTYVGKIHLIDLAGSENTNKSGVTGQGMKEAQNINKSLSALGDVIQALVKKDPHTPYRNSKLTMMLKDSLGGDSKTLMIVCSSPAQTNVTETLSSLNFASRARNVELGKAKKNSVAGSP